MDDNNSEDLRSIVIALQKRVDTLEKLLRGNVSAKPGEETTTATAVKFSRRQVSSGCGTFLWDWFQGIDVEIVAYLTQLDTPADFKQDVLCARLVKPELLFSVAGKVAATPSLADHWELINLYPLSLGRFIPMIPTSQCTNGMRVIYERIYFYVYNRARTLLAKIQLDGVFDLTAMPVLEAKHPDTNTGGILPLLVPKKEVGEVQPGRRFTPPVIVINDSDEETEVAKGPSLPAQLPVASLEKVRLVNPTTPPKRKQKKRAPVSPLHEPESPVKKPEPKKSRANRKSTRRILFKEPQPVEPEREEPEASSSSEEELPSKRAHKPSRTLLESVAQSTSPDKEEESDDDAAPEPTDVPQLLQQFADFVPSPSQLEAKKYQFTSSELTKALRPMRAKAPTPQDLFVAMATTIDERLQRAPLLPLKLRGTAEARKKMAVFSFQFYPGLTIIKGKADPLLPFKLHFDAITALSVDRSPLNLETVIWKRFLVSNALLWASVKQPARILQCLQALKLDVPEALPNQKELTSFFEALPMTAWDTLLEEMVFDFAGTPNLESPLIAPKNPSEAGKWIVHPFAWTGARNAKTGVVVAPATASAPTPKQANVRLSLLLWGLFPQPTEIPSILAHWVSLFLGIDMAKVRIKPTTTSPLWTMCWNQLP